MEWSLHGPGAAVLFRVRCELGMPVPNLSPECEHFGTSVVLRAGQSGHFSLLRYSLQFLSTPDQIGVSAP